MTNTLFIGDTHLLSKIILKFVFKVIKQYNIKHIVFIGDYTDQFTCTRNSNLYINELKFLKNWIKAREKEGIKVTTLIGNHDVVYLLNKPQYYSLANSEFNEVNKLLSSMNLQVAVKVNDFIVSHAGFTESYDLEDWHFKPITLEDYDELNLYSLGIGISRGGNYKLASPLWADFNDELSNRPNINYKKQIVGHTPVKTIKNIDNLWCIDTFSLDRSLLPIGDGSLLAIIDGKTKIIDNPSWTTLTNLNEISSHLTGKNLLDGFSNLNYSLVKKN